MRLTIKLFGLFVAAFVFNAFAVNVNPDQSREVVVAQNCATEYFSETNSDPLKADCFFTAVEAVFSNLSNRIQSARIPTSFFKTSNHNSFHRLNLFFSRITQGKLLAAESAFATYYSRKTKDGYYIYALCKLLI